MGWIHAGNSGSDWKWSPREAVAEWMEKNWGFNPNQAQAYIDYMDAAIGDVMKVFGSSSMSLKVWFHTNAEYADYALEIKEHCSFLEDAVAMVEQIPSYAKRQEIYKVWFENNCTSTEAIAAVLAPEMTPEAKKTASSVNYEAEYNAKYGVVLGEKSEKWYMENVYPLSINDWAAQQLGYALPDAEEIEAISF